MGKKELIEKILTDAKERASGLEEEALNQVRQIQERTRETELQLEAENEALIRDRISAIMENARSQAELEAKKLILAAKWKVIQQLSEQVKQAVLNSPNYPVLLKQMAEKYARGETKVRLSPADTERYGKQLMVSLGNPVPISGGMLVERPREEIDCSIDSMLNQVVDENITELAKILFS